MAHRFQALTISEFVNKIEEPNFQDLITQEFEELKSIKMQGTFNHFYMNMNRNRYETIPCWDNSRVLLSSHGTEEYEHAEFDESWSNIVITRMDSPSTYIHANYVDGFEDDRKFIICQGPMEHTAGDLWKLVWQQNTNMMVALTDVDNDICHEYWVTADDHRIIYGRYVVETVAISWESEIMISNLKITDVTTGESRPITHYWYADWPDHGTPESLKVVAELLTRVNKQREELLKETRNNIDLTKPGPILVHCAAGIGRSGTFCAADHAIGQLKKEKKICVQESVVAVRKMRHLSVMNPRQYMFIYEMIKHVLSAEGNLHKTQ